MMVGPGRERAVHPSTFSGLATELKITIFSFVRSKADQGRVCLVSQVIVLYREHVHYILTVL
jgi:hypothetical protein